MVHTTVHTTVIPTNYNRKMVERVKKELNL